MRKKRTIHLSNPQMLFPREIVALTKINATVTSRESKYLRKFRDAGKRGNPRRAARDRRCRLAVVAIDQYGPNPQRRSGRKIEMLRVADMHRVVRGDPRACERSVVDLAPRLGKAGLGGNRDRIEVAGQVEAVENSIQAIVEIGDHAQFESITF